MTGTVLVNNFLLAKILQFLFCYLQSKLIPRPVYVSVFVFMCVPGFEKNLFHASSARWLCGHATAVAVQTSLFLEWKNICTVLYSISVQHIYKLLYFAQYKLYTV